MDNWFTRFQGRDPNAKLLRQQWSALNMMKRYHAMFVGIVIVLGHTTYEQLQDPTIVRLPRQDGRSMVT